MACNKLVMEVNQKCPRGFSFTIKQNGQPMDLTNYNIVFMVKFAPYYTLPDIIKKTITLDSDTATVGRITDPTQGQFTVQITDEDTIKVPPNEYSLMLNLVETTSNIVTKLSGEGNKYAIFRVCTM